MSEPDNPSRELVSKRFRGFLPVVVDVETGGFNPATDGLLEIAAVMLDVDETGAWRRADTLSYHVKPFEGANLEPEALKFTGIDPFHPFRIAISEEDALTRIFDAVRERVSYFGCSRAILVGHNAWFDLAFLKAASDRCRMKKNPFHAFSSFDTASLAGLVYGQTVLARAAKAADLGWDEESAHSASYDAQMTADLFCAMVNRYAFLQERAALFAGTPAKS